MKKTPTLFKRDTNNMSRVVNEVHPDCAWVIAGEGVATRKYDGTCCMVRDDVLYKRRELKGGKQPPEGFELVDSGAVTGKVVGWMPVTDAPADKYHSAAFRPGLQDGTYELLGPSIQGNPEGYEDHQLLRHADAEVLDAPRTFDELREWLAGKDIEGIVWHHPDGRMAKIKLRDFGLPRIRDTLTA